MNWFSETTAGVRAVTNTLCSAKPLKHADLCVCGMWVLGGRGVLLISCSGTELKSSNFRFCFLALPASSVCRLGYRILGSWWWILARGRCRDAFCRVSSAFLLFSKSYCANKKKWNWLFFWLFFFQFKNHFRSTRTYSLLWNKNKSLTTY